MCNVENVRSTYIYRDFMGVSSQCSDTIVSICLFVRLKENRMQVLRCNSLILQIHS
jgi:hypothetical protein